MATQQGNPSAAAGEADAGSADTDENVTDDGGADEGAAAAAAGEGAPAEGEATADQGEGAAGEGGEKPAGEQKPAKLVSDLTEDEQRALGTKFANKTMAAARRAERAVDSVKTENVKLREDIKVYND